MKKSEAMGALCSGSARDVVHRVTTFSPDRQVGARALHQYLFVMVVVIVRGEGSHEAQIGRGPTQGN
jgi:hypothetical protein